MRISIAFLLVLTAACGGPSKPATGPSNTTGGTTGETQEGPPVVEVAASTSKVTGAEQFATTLHDSAVNALASDAAFATEGGPASYRLDANLDALSATPGTPMGSVQCKVNITLMTSPEMSMFGTLNGAATVEAAPGEEAAAQHDCIAAVIDNLVSTKVLPALHDRLSGK